MPTTQQENLKRFTEAYQVFSDSFTKQEFLEAFKQVIDFVREMQMKNVGEMARLSRVHEEMMKKIEGDNSGMIDSAMKEMKKKIMDMCEPMMKEMQKEHEAVMKGMTGDMKDTKSDHSKMM